MQLEAPADRAGALEVVLALLEFLYGYAVTLSEASELGAACLGQVEFFEAREEVRICV